MIRVLVVPDGFSWAEMGRLWVLIIPQITEVVRNKNSRYLKVFFKIMLVGGVTLQALKAVAEKS